MTVPVLLVLIVVTVALVVVAIINAGCRLTRPAILGMCVALVVGGTMIAAASVALARASTARERAACVAQGGTQVERQGRYVGCAYTVRR